MFHTRVHLCMYDPLYSLSLPHLQPLPKPLRCNSLGYPGKNVLKKVRFRVLINFSAVLGVLLVLETMLKEGGCLHERATVLYCTVLYCTVQQWAREIFGIEGN